MRWLRSSSLAAALLAAGCGRSGFASLGPPSSFVPTPIVSPSATATPPPGSGFLVDSFAGSSASPLEGHNPDVGRPASWAPMAGTAAASLKLSGASTLYVGATGPPSLYANSTPPATCTGGDLVQQITHKVGNSTTDLCTLPANPTPGNNLIFVGGALSGSLTVSGGGVTTWHRAVRSILNTNVEIWYGEGTSGGTGSAIVTYNCGANGPMVCWVGELSGLAPTLSLDTAAVVGATGNGSPISPGSITTGASQELLVLGASAYDQATFGTPSAGAWTAFAQINGGNNNTDQVEFVRKSQVLGTSVGPSFSMNSNGAAGKFWDAAIAAFKAPGPGADYAVAVTGRWAVLDPQNKILLATRVQADGSRYQLSVAGAGANNLVLQKFTPGPGALTQTSQTLSVNTDYTILLQMRGSALSVYLNGSHIAALDATDASITRPGTSAVGIGRNTAGTADVTAAALDATCR